MEGFVGTTGFGNMTVLSLDCPCEKGRMGSWLFMNILSICRSALSETSGFDLVRGRLTDMTVIIKLKTS